MSAHALMINWQSVARSECTVPTAAKREGLFLMRRIWVAVSAFRRLVLKSLKFSCLAVAFAIFCNICGVATSLAEQTPTFQTESTPSVDDLPFEQESDVASESANASPKLALSHKAINWKKVTTGRTAIAVQIVLTDHSSKRPVHIASIVSTDPAFVASQQCVATIPASGNCSFSISFYSNSPGKHSAKVKINDDAAHSPQIVKLKAISVGPPVPTPTPTATPSPKSTTTPTSTPTPTTTPTPTPKSTTTPTSTPTPTTTPTSTPTPSPVGIHITSLNSTSSSPFGLLTISGTGFDPNSTTTVTFFDASGYSMSVAPLQLTPTSLVAGVPPPFDPLTLAVGDSRTVSVQVTATSNSGSVQSNVIDGFQIQSLPPAPPLPPGTLTLAFLIGTAGSAELQAALLTDPTVLEIGASETAQFNYLNQLIASIQTLLDVPSAVLTVSDNAHHQLKLSAIDLTASDRIIAGLFTVLAAQTAAPSAALSGARDKLSVGEPATSKSARLVQSRLANSGASSALTPSCVAPGAQKVIQAAYTQGTQITDLGNDIDSYYLQLNSCTDPSDELNAALIMGGFATAAIGATTSYGAIVGWSAILLSPSLTSYLVTVGTEALSTLVLTPSGFITSTELITTAVEVLAVSNPLALAIVVGGVVEYGLLESPEIFNGVNDAFNTLVGVLTPGFQPPKCTVEGGKFLQCGDVCVDPISDPVNCGGCAGSTSKGNNVCPSAVCSGGLCTASFCGEADSVTNALTECIDPGSLSVFCADLKSDPNNCGLCNFSCASGADCINSHCICPAGLGFCQGPHGGSCVDLTSDPNHCGFCDVNCGVLSPDRPCCIASSVPGFPSVCGLTEEDAANPDGDEPDCD